jgi:Tfp pilus assembly protein PilP
MMTHLLSIVIVLLVWSAAPASDAAAQPPEAEAAGQTAAQPPAPVDPQAPPVPPPNYTYSSEGRRDPFRSLVNTGTDGPSGPRLRPDGVPGLAVNDVIVRGILKTPDGFIAMVQAPNGRTYTVRAGDQLFDGRVRTITAEALFIMQDVNDPLSRETEREVRKPLRGGAEG